MELELERVPFAQKLLIARAKKALQMLCFFFFLGGGGGVFLP